MASGSGGWLVDSLLELDVSGVRDVEGVGVGFAGSGDWVDDVMTKLGVCSDFVNLDGSVDTDSVDLGLEPMWEVDCDTGEEVADVICWCVGNSSEETEGSGDGFDGRGDKESEWPGDGFVDKSVEIAWSDDIDVGVKGVGLMEAGNWDVDMIS